MNNRKKLTKGMFVLEFGTHDKSKEIRGAGNDKRLEAVEWDVQDI